MERTVVNYITEQENFWAGKFGDEYIERNKNELTISTNISLFNRILTHTCSVSSIIEFGANIGHNLIALKKLLPQADISAIEINQKAIRKLELINGIHVYAMSIIDFQPDFCRDFVFTKGVLIHIDPDMLPNIYDILYKTSKRYICIAEYYSPTPTEVNYRGFKERLFKRDFAGEILAKYEDVKLIDYGFVYHGDNNFPQDDVNWFLLEKNNGTDKNKYCHHTSP